MKLFKRKCKTCKGAGIIERFYYEEVRQIPNALGLVEGGETYEVTRCPECNPSKIYPIKWSEVTNG